MNKKTKNFMEKNFLRNIYKKTSDNFVKYALSNLVNIELKYNLK